MSHYDFEYFAYLHFMALNMWEVTNSFFCNTNIHSHTYYGYLPIVRPNINLNLSWPSEGEMKVKEINTIVHSTNFMEDFGRNNIVHLGMKLIIEIFCSLIFFGTEVRKMLCWIITTLWRIEQEATYPSTFISLQVKRAHSDWLIYTKNERDYFSKTQ